MNNSHIANILPATRGALSGKADSAVDEGKEQRESREGGEHVEEEGTRSMGKRRVTLITVSIRT